MRCSSISFASLRASSTGCTCVRKARPKHSLEEAFDLLLDVAEDAHAGGECYAPAANSNARASSASARRT